MPHTITARHIKRHGPNVTRPKAPLTRQLITMVPVIGYQTDLIRSATHGIVRLKTYTPILGEGEIILHPTKGFRAMGATTPWNEMRKKLHAREMELVRKRKPVAKVTYDKSNVDLFWQAMRGTK